jgi:hypothetical protein
LISSGTNDCKQAMDNSSTVRVIEKNPPEIAQVGKAAPASSLQTAKASGSKVS